MRTPLKGEASDDLEALLPAPAPLPPTAAAGTFPDTPDTWASVVQFVSSAPDRLVSPERDFGLRWRDGSDFYRAALIEDTGELYVVKLGSPDLGGGHVQRLATGVQLDELEGWLNGWEEVMDDPDSLGWLRGRIGDGPRLVASGSGSLR